MANGTAAGDPPAEPKPLRKKRSEEDDIEKARRLEIEAEDLQASLASANLDNLKTRVAWVLNYHQETRDSDVSLALKYWESFQPELYNSTSLVPRDLFKLERMTNITRVRAKIQNEYMLFPASDGVRNRRRQMEEDVAEAVVDDKPGRNVVNIFSDETGKTQDYICVVAAWVLTGHSVWKLSQAIWKWKTASPWANGELHFKHFKKDQLPALHGYLDVIVSNREFLSFKAIALQKSTTSRHVDDVVHRLHEFMVTEGVKHEVDNNRIRLPHEVTLTIDSEQSLDKITCADIRRRIAQDLRVNYNDNLTIADVAAVTSHSSPMIQLADVVAGAVNRRKNFDGDRNYKDEMADAIFERLNIQLEPGDVPGLDATTWLSF